MSEEFRKLNLETRSLAWILENLPSEDLLQLCKWFDEIPLVELRDPILDHLIRRNFPDGFSNWVEDRIQQLEDSVDSRNRSLAKRLFNWYLFNSDGESAIRALEFGAAYVKKNSWIRDSVSGEICNRIKKNPSLYWGFPSIERFIETLIKPIEKPPLGYYTESHWLSLERAVRFIVEARDVNYLDRIETVLLSLKKGETKPFEFITYKWDEFGRHIRFLEDAVVVLKKEQDDQFPDLNAVFGSHLRKTAGLKNSVNVALSYPEHFHCLGSGNEADHALIELAVSASKASEEQYLLEILKKYDVQFFLRDLTLLDTEMVF